MNAVIKTGGKQYRVSEGTVLKVEKLAGEVGASVDIPDVLSVGEGDGIKIGTPLVEGASVKAEILEHGKGKKILIFKKKRRKGYSRKQGHRQLFTCIKISEIKGA